MDTDTDTDTDTETSTYVPPADMIYSISWDQVVDFETFETDYLIEYDTTSDILSNLKLTLSYYSEQDGEDVSYSFPLEIGDGLQTVTLDSDASEFVLGRHETTYTITYDSGDETDILLDSGEYHPLGGQVYFVDFGITGVTATSDGVVVDYDYSFYDRRGKTEDKTFVIRLMEYEDETSTERVIDEEIEIKSYETHGTLTFTGDHSINTDISHTYQYFIYLGDDREKIYTAGSFTPATKVKDTFHRLNVGGFLSQKYYYRTSGAVYIPVDILFNSDTEDYSENNGAKFTITYINNTTGVETTVDANNSFRLQTTNQEDIQGTRYLQVPISSEDTIQRTYSGTDGAFDKQIEITSVGIKYLGTLIHSVNFNGGITLYPATSTSTFVPLGAKIDYSTISRSNPTLDITIFSNGSSSNLSSLGTPSIIFTYVAGGAMYTYEFSKSELNSDGQSTITINLDKEDGSIYSVLNGLTHHPVKISIMDGSTGTSYKIADNYTFRLTD